MVTERDPGSLWTDLKAALGAWRRFPWLPAISLGIAFLILIPFRQVAWLWAILTAGWIGTERICYLRAFRRLPISATELRQFVAAFVGRFVALGLLVCVPFIPIGVVIGIVAAAHIRPGTTPDIHFSRSFLVVVFVFTAVIDVVLTFVTPALVFTTRKARQALSLGVSMIRQTWPSCALYVLVPPLAVVVVGQGLARTADAAVWIRIVPLAVSTLLSLLFKGATARFYLREHTVGNDGAAFVHTEQIPPAVPSRSRRLEDDKSPPAVFAEFKEALARIGKVEEDESPLFIRGTARVLLWKTSVEIDIQTHGTGSIVELKVSAGNWDMGARMAIERLVAVRKLVSADGRIRYR